MATQEGKDLTNYRKSRPNKHEHLMNRAKVVAERSTCLRRKVGAIIVDKDGVVLSSGYSGAPRKMKHCLEIGDCLRTSLGIPSGERYELCRSVHAEQNAIINAARTGATIVGGEMHISSEKVKNAYSDGDGNDKVYGPCIICKKEIINAGLEMVYLKEDGVTERRYTLEQIKRLLIQEEAKWRKNLRRNKIIP
ncbi:MAG: cytidine deaminase [Candidatus Bathyarchaeota archaeon]|nr:cytidine deaminase [Candidatus Bathyarchaeota archaeon]